VRAVCSLLVLGVVAALSICLPASAKDRISVTIPIPIEDVGARVDELIKAKGRQKKGAFRLSWRGPTRIEKQVGETLYVSSRVRVSHKWFGRDTKTLKGTIRFFVDGDAIAVRGELTNIRNFPNWIERAVGEWFNVEFARVVQIIDRDRLDKNPLLRGVNARVDGLSVAHRVDTQDVVVTVKASFTPPDVTKLAEDVADAIAKGPAVLLEWAK